MNAQNAGAVAIIIYNNEPAGHGDTSSGGAPMEMGGSHEEIDSEGVSHDTLMDSITIPVLSIGEADALQLTAAIKAAPASVKVSLRNGVSLVSLFS